MTHLDMVREFHEAFDHPVRTGVNADVPEKILRMNLIEEEVRELGEALGLYRDWDGLWQEATGMINLPSGKVVGEVDTVEVADALADIDYVVQGAALVFGLPHDEVFAEVHRSNMAKLVNGEVIRREDGKILKPEGWTPPDVAGVLYGE